MRLQQQMTAADSITQLLPTALTSTRLIDMQRAEGEVLVVVVGLELRSNKVKQKEENPGRGGK